MTLSDAGSQIVIVEDDEHVAKLIELSVGRAGYETRTISDGNEALEYITSHDVSLVFVDLGVSGLSGEELCSKLKATRETESIPIIVISGNVDIRQAAEACGADGFLSKPFEIGDLTSLVKSYV